MILAGQISEGAGGPRLRIEAPTLLQGTVEIAEKPSTQLVRVRVKGGVGWVEDRSQMRSLFGKAAPARTGDSWGGVLWERVSKKFAPFPVVVPLAAGDHGTPDGALFDLVWEELGVWPAQADGEEVERDDEQTESTDEDDDLQALAEAKHEGQLDRLAVAASVIRKRIATAAAGSAYAKARLDLLRTQVAKLDIPKHVRRALVDYLNSPNRAPRSK